VGLDQRPNPGFHFQWSIHLVAGVLPFQLDAHIALESESPDQLAIAPPLGSHVLGSHSVSAHAAQLLAGEAFLQRTTAILGALATPCSFPQSGGIAFAVVGRVLHEDQRV